ncbi:MAG TPA: MATE family efflux transporter [Candidatus Scybalomonas excrementigallinarum]|nr:MATE family efflux transporter [Candidatus Scybalomonas excrementigallinarum]
MGRTNDLGRDPIVSLVIRLAIPTMIAQFVNVLYAIVDRMYIGNIPQIGDTALAGVGVCSPIITLLTSFGTLVGIGGSVLVSMRLGEKNQKKAEEILANCFLMLVILSVILTLLFLLLKGKLLIWFGASSTTFPYANTYLTIYTAGTFFALMALGMNYFIICQGYSTIGMLTVLIGAILNIILDSVFIFVFQLGVAGAALATVISQFASCLFVICFLFSKKPKVRITFSGYSFFIIKRVLMIGFSPFVILATDSVLIIALNTVLQHYGGSDGDMLIAAATIVQSYMTLITAPMLGITGGSQPLLSYNYGAKEEKRVTKGIQTVVVFCLIFTTIMFFISRFLPQYFVRLFTSDPSYMELSIWGIKVFTLSVIPLSFQYAFVDTFTALSATKVALCLSLARKALYLMLTILLPILFVARSAFYAEPLSDFIASITSTLVFFLFYKKHMERRLAGIS